MAGKERDPESGLDNFGARYYASSYARFMSPDPGHAGAVLANPESWDAYSYVVNNPETLTDPSGTAPCNPKNAGGCDEEGIVRAAVEMVSSWLNPLIARRQRLIGAQNSAMKNKKFVPGYGGHTHCNQGTCSVASSVGAPMGPLVNGGWPSF